MPGVAVGPAPASYGASQAGVVLRYRLSMGGHRLTAYTRLASALGGSRQREAAAGLSARPLPRLPVIAAVELRVQNDRAGTRHRPVASVITQLPPIPLPEDLRAEVYVQAGYAAGKDPTPFADGQIRLDRRTGGMGGAELRLGLGAWGGAQRGAARLDIGPAAAAQLPLGRRGSARVALDWRFRVAGNAAPASGPAITLSTGF